MIHELRISSLGVIEEAAAVFHPGFTAVTGETGAGKTMVVSGLGLLAGGRADPAMVRTGAAQASVEGLVDAAPPVQARILEAGGVMDDEAAGPRVIATRLVASRARSVLGGRSVPTPVLAEVMASLLVIHGQHEQTRLGQRALVILDAYAGNDGLVADMALAHARLRAVERELADLARSERERARELDMLGHALDEIAAIDPKPGEDAELAVESERLANAESLLDAARSSEAALTGDDGSGPPDVMGLLAGARRALSAAAAHDPALTIHEDTLRSLMAQVGELASDLASYSADIEADPARLAHVQQRRADLAGLTRKYGADLTEVLDWAQRSALRASQLAGAEDRIETLTAQAQAAREEAGRTAAQLHELRLAAADRFAGAVAAELAALAMPRARVGFVVRTAPDPAGVPLPGVDGPVALRATGVDEVDLLLAANPGAPMRPIGQAASGGELSRVMLAVQVVLAGADPVPTMVFDEVDAGVGGAAAIEVGRRLRQLSRVTQVIVVTHLPQVAAFAQSQLVVTKDSSGLVTHSSIREVSGEDRVRELSRMLGGLADSAAGAEHARELLDLYARG